MEEQILEVLESLVEGRNEFFVRTMQLTPHQQRGALASRYMLNEICFLEIINRLYQNQIRSQSTVLTVSVPANFEDNVPILPTQQQINSSLENIEPTTNNCAICQESVSSGACRIRQCGHVYHRSCILSWFGLNVRCPVCRHDIREGHQATAAGQSDQTPSDEE
jgi:hypothetical protein